MRFVLSTATTLAVASVALGQEFPDPNPVPQADGTFLWYVGNNTQCPVIQDVLEAVADGDEVVVRGGLYVESLHIDNNELTIRPFVNSDAEFEAVTFLNPTEGFNNDNGWSANLEFILNGGTNYTSGSTHTSYASHSNTDGTRGGGTTLALGAAVGDIIRFTGIQLELGEQGTPFEHRSFADELARCQRYTCRWVANAQFANFLVGRSYNTTQGTAVMTTPVSMRALPTLTTTSVSGNFTYSHSALSLASHEDNLFQRFTIASTGSFTANGAYAVEADAADVFMQLDAEL